MHVIYQIFLSKMVKNKGYAYENMYSFWPIELLNHFHYLLDACAKIVRLNSTLINFG